MAAQSAEKDETNAVAKPSTRKRKRKTPPKAPKADYSDSPLTKALQRIEEEKSHGGTAATETVEPTEAPDHSHKAADGNYVTLGDLIMERQEAVSVLPKDPDRVLRELLDHRGWDVRTGQSQMVQAIDKAITSSQDASVKAPVGTGKTIGYVIPALTRGSRVIIATSTKSLQDQIVEEELPKLQNDLREMYGVELSFAVLKGRANYLCESRANAMLSPKSKDSGLFADEVGNGIVSPQIKSRVKELMEQSKSQVRNAAGVTKFDIGDEIKTLPAEVRKSISATGTCADRTRIFGGMEEPLVSSCAYRTARIKAVAAHVVVVNTSLLSQELKNLRAFGTSDDRPNLLAGADTIIVDEAHHFPRNIAESMTSKFDCLVIEKRAEKIERLVQETGFDKTNPSESAEITATVNSARGLSSRIVNAFRKTEDRSNAEYREALFNALMVPTEGLRKSYALARIKDGNGEYRYPGLYNSMSKLGEALGEVYEVRMTVRQEDRETKEKQKQEGKLHDDEKSFAYYVHLANDDENDAEVTSVPMDVSFIRQMLAGAGTRSDMYNEPSRARNTLVLSSGTITTRTAVSLGLSPKSMVEVESPFDPDRVRMFIPTGPNSEKANIAKVKKAILNSGGRTLVLTTSNKRLDHYTEALRGDKEISRKFNIYSQLDGLPTGTTKQMFSDDETSVLVGTMTFWEGIDIPGQSLSQVIIDKIPFPMKSDPYFNARQEYEAAQGLDVFKTVVCNQAAIMLAQGTGRLARTTDDLGGLMVLDSRMHKFYPVRSLLEQNWSYTEDFDDYLSWMREMEPSDFDANWKKIGLRSRPAGGNRGRGRVNLRASKG